jgi:hypothetical protein
MGVRPDWNDSNALRAFVCDLFSTFPFRLSEFRPVAIEICGGGLDRSPETWDWLFGGFQGERADSSEHEKMTAEVAATH